MSFDSCRLCNASSIKLTSSIHDEIISKFLTHSIPHIQINSNSKFSTKVCQLCYGKAKLSFDFINRIEQVQLEIEKKKQEIKIENSFEIQRMQLKELSRQIHSNANTFPAGISVRKASEIKQEVELFEEEETNDYFGDDVYEPEEDEEFIESENDDDDDYKPIKVSPSKKKPAVKIGNSSKDAEDEKEVFIDAPVHYSCGKCKARYDSLETLTIHMKEKNCFAPDPAVCKICQKVFKNKKSLYSHEKNAHLRKNKLMCELCAKEFTTSYDLGTHMETVHRRVVRRDCIFKCTHCHAMFNSHLDLLDHVKEHKREKKEAPRLCEICARVCPNLKAYTSHMTIHREKKTHVCTECGKGFMKAFLLVQHMHIHTGIKAYNCEICNKSYAKRDSLRIHKRRDHPDFIIP